ncbi:MAG: hypothetical protein AB1861_23600 [Cyanobacteriota bacterium]
MALILKKLANDRAAKRQGVFLPKAKQPHTLQPPCRQVYARVRWQYMRGITET